MTSDKDSAAFHQSHKDDENEWDEPVPAPASTSRRLASMISTRFAPAEAEMIRRAAEAEGRSLSQFVRLAALARAGGPVSSSGPMFYGTRTTALAFVQQVSHVSQSGLGIEIGGQLMPIARQSA